MEAFMVGFVVCILYMTGEHEKRDKTRHGLNPQTEIEPSTSEHTRKILHNHANLFRKIGMKSK